MDKNGYGEILKKARETQGLKYQDVYKVLKIDPSYLIAMEEEDGAKFGGAIYMKLFLKTYSTFLKVDYKEIVKMYSETLPKEEARKETGKETESMKRAKEGKKMEEEAKKEIANMKEPFSFEMHYNRKSIMYAALIGLAAIALIAVVVIVIVKMTGGGKGVYVVAPPVAMQVTAKAVEDVWMKVRSDDGEKELNLKKGEEKTWKDVQKMVFLLGNAGGVEFVVNGDNIGTIGDQGEVINGLVFETGKNWYIDKKQAFRNIKGMPKPAGAAENAGGAAVPAGATQ